MIRLTPTGKGINRGRPKSLMVNMVQTGVKGWKEVTLGVTSTYSSERVKETVHQPAEAQRSAAWGGVESPPTTELRGASATAKKKFRAGQGQRMPLQDLNPR